MLGEGKGPDKSSQGLDWPETEVWLLVWLFLA